MGAITSRVIDAVLGQHHHGISGAPLPQADSVLRPQHIIAREARNAAAQSAVEGARTSVRLRVDWRTPCPVKSCGF